MTNDELRRRIVLEAARLLFHRQESEYERAKLKAARKIGRGRVRRSDLPGNREIHAEIQRLIAAGEDRWESLLDGAASSAGEDGTALTAGGTFPRPFARSVADDHRSPLDRFLVYRALLLPLARVEQDRRRHPEGDALYHSLQVFDLACDEIPYDEEFLLAALLHDVGKALDPDDHVNAGLEALEEVVTERTAWLIANHQQAHAVLDRTIGARARRRLQRSEDFDELVLLARCDRDGRVAGAQVPDVEEALQYLRDLARENG